MAIEFGGHPHCKLTDKGSIHDRRVSEEQLAIRSRPTIFADRLAPDFQRLDVEGQLNREAIEEMGSLGLVAPPLPEDLGGLGAGSVTPVSSWKPCLKPIQA